MSVERKYISKSVEETQQIAFNFVKEHPELKVYALHGNLGAGKTALTAGIAAALDIHQPIKSPTFTIINEYAGGGLPLYHIDLYRLNSPDEALMLGFEDYLESNGVTVVEWPERASELFPEDTVHITLTPLDDPNHREIRLFFYS
ncbi:MAG: tRNA (adenosine(37)-N6)-threonylcarbamoyltransferase complex ATPase subunit type 1 TsaE [Kiritimatiellae bacterium]|jgi:tRNA threonylcarbamoyladenosine biosynthesis protein TsaE|nr:tRNA (adenosine(37)-N6)-threonylcarbamoyltransferase complex ATPase subunit type 1 TsaE [Kiritimatiellia bacterium]